MRWFNRFTILWFFVVILGFFLMPGSHDAGHFAGIVYGLVAVPWATVRVFAWVNAKQKSTIEKEQERD